jgi:hypothetical protein
MAMVARAYGRHARLDDAHLVHQLDGLDGMINHDTQVSAMNAMADRLGLFHQQIGWNGLRSALEDDRLVWVLGRNRGSASKHYMLATKLTLERAPRLHGARAGHAHGRVGGELAQRQYPAGQSPMRA